MYHKHLEMFPEHSSNSINPWWLKQLYVTRMLILRSDQSRAGFDDLDWHGVSDCSLNLESWSAEMSIAPLGQGRTLGAQPCLCHRMGTREGPCLPKLPWGGWHLLPVSSVHGTSISRLFNCPKGQLWPRHHPQQAAQGLHCRGHAPLHFPISGLHSLPFLPTHLPHRLLHGFLWGFPLWGFAPLVLSALSVPPPSKSQHFWGHLQAFFTRALYGHNLFKSDLHHCYHPLRPLFWTEAHPTSNYSYMHPCLKPSQAAGLMRAGAMCPFVWPGPCFIPRV